MTEPVTLAWQDVSSEAPEGPGLYAWYGNLHYGSADLRDAAAFRRLLDRHSQRYALADLPVVIRGPFGRSWSGSAHSESATGVLSQPSGLQEVSESESDRKAMADLLMSLAPMFSAPLYVGVSKNVKHRLGTHQRHIVARLDSSEADVDAASSRDAEFADRVVGAGFSPSHLTVVVRELIVEAEDETETAVQRARRLVEAAEWYLNRWFTPVFGRR